ncbi:MAG: hypothetical protein L0206_26345, partial [Actinobacteria bacterium]|nr:hypothetical protein [Actinomycetota bacterium]
MRTNGSRTTEASRRGSTRSDTRSSRAARRRRRRNRSIALASALVVVVLAGLAGAWTLLRSDSPSASKRV